MNSIKKLLCILTICCIICSLCVLWAGRAYAEDQGVYLEIDTASIRVGNNGDSPNIFLNSFEANATGMDEGGFTIGGTYFDKSRAPLIYPVDKSTGLPATPLELFHYNGNEVSGSIHSKCSPPDVEFRCKPTTAHTGGTYRWRIVLQGIPCSDINIKIYACVMMAETMGSGGIYYNKIKLPTAAQTGTWVENTGHIIHVPTSNPKLEVWAEPGPGHNFVPFHMTALKMPSLTDRNFTDDAHDVLLNGSNDTRFTMISNSPAQIVLKLPEDSINEMGQTTTALEAGDMINIIVGIPEENCVDICLGRDSALLVYNARIDQTGESVTNLIDGFVDQHGCYGPGGVCIDPSYGRQGCECEGSIGGRNSIPANFEIIYAYNYYYVYGLIEFNGESRLQDIEINSVKLNNTIPVYPFYNPIGDFDNDGIEEMIVYFPCRGTDIGSGNTSLTVTGKLKDGITTFGGIDTVCIQSLACSCNNN
ncbi:MAG: hypothetical protein ACMUJM_21465 [bacterium]